VWVGRPEGDVPMTNVRGIAVTGGSFPARIFSRYMRGALAGKPAQPLYTVSPDELSLRAVPPGARTTGPPPTGTSPPFASTVPGGDTDGGGSAPGGAPPVTFQPGRTVPPATAPRPRPTSPTTSPPSVTTVSPPTTSRTPPGRGP
jgi:penicillin-binding protein 1A